MFSNPSSTARSQPAHWIAVGLYTILSIPIVFYKLGEYGLVNDDEAYYQYYARHMLSTGNWFRFEFAGESRFYDAFTHGPLFVWLKAVVIGIFGDNYWTMRSVSAVFALLAVCATYFLACRLMDRRAALLAGLLHLTTFQFVYLHGARTGEMETMIACWMTLIALFFLRAVEGGKSFVPHHVLIVGLLWSKAALVLIPIMAEWIYFAVHSSQRRHLRDWFKHGLWIFPLGGIWHLAQMALNWQEFQETFETLGKLAGGGKASAGPLGNLRYYLPVLFWGGFPQSLFYPVGVLSFMGLGRDDVERRSWNWLGILSLSVLGFYALVARAFPWYITPLYSILSIGVAGWFARLTGEALRPWLWILTLCTLAMAPWVRINKLFTLNPFRGRAFTIVGDVDWVGVAGFSAPLCVAVSLALAVAIGSKTYDRLPTGVVRGFALGVLVVMLGVAGQRLIVAFEHTDHISRLERFVRDLETRRERKGVVEYPINIPSPHPMMPDGKKVRYFLWDQYELEEFRKHEYGYWVFFRITGEKTHLEP